MMRRYTFKVYPRPCQADQLDRMRRLHCALYNATLQERIDQYRHECERVGRKAAKGLSCYDQQKHLKVIRADDPEFAAMSSDSLTKTLERVDLAFKSFFKRARAGAGHKSGYPRFKSSDLYVGFGLKRHRSGWNINLESNRLYIKGIAGLLRIRGKLPFTPKSIKGCDMSYRAGTWWLSVIVEMSERTLPKGKSEGEIKFDLVDSFAVVRTADGGCAAGPVETVYTAAEGQIIPEYQCAAQGSPATDPESGADRREIEPEANDGFPATDPESGADRRYPRRYRRSADPAASPESGAERGKDASMAAAVIPAASPESGDDRGNRLTSGLPAPSPESRIERRHSVASLPRHLPAPSPESGTERGESYCVHRLALPAADPESGTDRGAPVPGNEHGRNIRDDDSKSPAAGSESGDERGVTGVTAAGLQKRMARCVRGSYRYRALRQRKARLEARNARRRREGLHLWTTSLARCFGELTIIRPASIADETRSGKGNTREMGAEVSLKADLNKKILDQAPSMAVQMLEYKIEERGGVVTIIDDEAAPTSIGNEIVEARKSNRKLRRIIRNEHRPYRRRKNLKKSA